MAAGLCGLERPVRCAATFAHGPQAPAFVGAPQKEHTQCRTLDPKRVISSSPHRTQSCAPRVAACPSTVPRDHSTPKRTQLSSKAIQAVARPSRAHVWKEREQDLQQHGLQPARSSVGSRMHPEKCPAKLADLAPAPPSKKCKADTFITKDCPSAAPTKPHHESNTGGVVGQHAQKWKRDSGLTVREALSVRLDQEAFRNFWPLLDESRDYARMSGCRFRSRSFDCLPRCDERISRAAVPAARGQSDDTDDRLSVARARAAPAVHRFTERLQAGEAALLEELDKAFRIVMAESVRSAMIGTCKLMELWPPSPAPPAVADEDCAFEDVSAQIPVIAQRLYNDENRRHCMMTRHSDVDPMRRRALMASFIVDFAAAAGVPLPELPETFDMMLRDFKAQALEWEQAHVCDVEEELLREGQMGALHEDVEQGRASEKENTWASMFNRAALETFFGAAEIECGKRRQKSSCA